MESLRRALTILALLLVAAGCGGRPGSGEEVFVFLPSSMDSRFWVDAERGMDAEARKLGVRAEFIGPAEADAGKQLTYFEEAIAREPAGIAVAAEDTEEIRETVARAREAGIPVVSWFYRLPDSGVVAHVGVDDFAAGEGAAGALAGALDGEGQVAVLTTSADAPGVELRREGFEKGLEAHPGVEVVYTGIAGEDLETIPSKVGSLLQARPDIDALYAAAGPELPSVAETVEDLGGCGEIRVAGFDATPEAVGLMREDCVQVIVAQKPYEATARALGLLDDLEQGGEPEDVLVDATTVTRGNLEEFLRETPP